MNADKHSTTNQKNIAPNTASILSTDTLASKKLSISQII